MAMHPKEAHTKFHEESMNFIEASSYLTLVHIAVAEGPQPYSGEHSNLTERLTPTYKDPHHYFMSRLFIAHIAAFELYLQEVVTSVVLRHPRKAGNVQFKLTDVLDADDKETLIQRAIDEVLNKLMYKKPLEYRDELAELLSVDKSLFSTHWLTFIEAKARRDLGVHAGWKCNATYLRKLTEAGLESTLKLGESAVPDWSDYLQHVADVLYEFAQILTSAVIKKHWS